jgi:WD40 repeat protein
MRICGFLFHNDANKSVNKDPVINLVSQLLSMSKSTSSPIKLTSISQMTIFGPYLEVSFDNSIKKLHIVPSLPLTKDDQQFQEKLAKLKQDFNNGNYNNAAAQLIQLMRCSNDPEIVLDYVTCLIQLKKLDSANSWLNLLLMVDLPDQGLTKLQQRRALSLRAYINQTCRRTAYALADIRKALLLGQADELQIELQDELTALEKYSSVQKKKYSSFKTEPNDNDVTRLLTEIKEINKQLQQTLEVDRSEKSQDLRKAINSTNLLLVNVANRVILELSIVNLLKAHSSDEIELNRDCDINIFAIRNINNVVPLLFENGECTHKVFGKNSGACYRSLNEHAGSINSVTINKDGTTIVSVSKGSTIKGWDIETFKTLSLKCSQDLLNYIKIFIYYYGINDRDFKETYISLLKINAPNKEFNQLFFPKIGFNLDFFEEVCQNIDSMEITIETVEYKGSLSNVC